MKQSDLDDAQALYVEILQRHNWDWWGRLSRFSSGSRDPITDRSPRQRILNEFEEWLEDLKKEEGGPDFAWARSYEKGLRGGDDTVRILIGGLRSRRRRWRERWSSSLLMSNLHNFSKHHSLETFEYLLNAKGRHGKLDLKYHFPPKAF
jgi:hypothetical protein